MSAIFHSNRYSAAAACPFCEAPEKHEPWCRVINDHSKYAYLIAEDPRRIGEGDMLALHGMGATWHEKGRR